MKLTPWFVYIVQNEKGYYYTGITTDLARRLKEHQQSHKGAKFFRTGAAVGMVFTREFPNRSEASKYECYIKKLSRQQKIALIRNKDNTLC